MSEHSYEYEDIDDVLPAEPRGELVHWMEPRPLSFGTTGISLTAAGAFALGLAAGVAVLALLHSAGRERRMSMPLERKLRRLS